MAITEKKTMTRFEHATLVVPIAELEGEQTVARMNARGAEGWKLVTSVVHERHGYSHEVHFFFVRKVR